MDENNDAQMLKKRKMDGMEHETGELRGATDGENGEEESEVNFSGSDEMRRDVNHILEKVIQSTGKMVSDMLEAGKEMFNKLNQGFEDRILMIHKEQIEKWQDEIKELRMIDSTNEAMHVRLNNVKTLLQTVRVHTSQ